MSVEESILKLTRITETFETIIDNIMTNFNEKIETGIYNW